MVRYRSREEIEKEAALILKRHGINTLPVDPVLLANREGIKVSNAVFTDDNISGLVAKRGNVTQFLINQNEPPYRKRFTIAHELGHHFLHLLSDGEHIITNVDLFREPIAPEKDIDDDRKMDVQANYFASAILMPEEFVKAEFEEDKEVKSLARKFNVSIEAMAYRLNNLGLA